MMLDTMVNLQPRYIRVAHAGREVMLAHYRLGQGEQRMLVIAGVHGREHGGSQVVYELLGRLAGVCPHGQMDMLPVCNPMAYTAETRFTPNDHRDMAHAFTSGRPADLTKALGQAHSESGKEGGSGVEPAQRWRRPLPTPPHVLPGGGRPMGSLLHLVDGRHRLPADRLVAATITSKEESNE